MQRKLFEIPFELNGVPIFGVGVLLAVWAVVSVAWLGWLVYKHGWGRDVASYAPILALVGALIYGLPMIFEDGLPVRGYGVMMLLGVVSGVGLSAHRAQRMGIDPEIILSLAFWMFVAGIVGARVFFVINHSEAFFRSSASVWEIMAAIVNVSKGGLVVYGSLIAVIPTVALFVYKHKLPGLALADLIAPGMVLGLAFGRVGCLLNGCCWGGACELPWAVTFPAHELDDFGPPYERQLVTGSLYGVRFPPETDDAGGAPARIEKITPDSPADRAGFEVGERITRINGRRVDSAARAASLLLRSSVDDSVRIETDGGHALDWTLPPRSNWIHPTQIYSATGAALLCLFLLAYYPFRTRDGQVFALMLTIYPIVRFLLEEIRDDAPDLSWTAGQRVSLMMLAGVIALWVYILRHPRGTAWPPAATG